MTRVVANNVVFHRFLPYKVIWQEFKVTEYVSTTETLRPPLGGLSVSCGDEGSKLLCFRRGLHHKSILIFIVVATP